MSYTPFEREMLKRQDRTIELLELLVMAHRPMKVMTGMAYTGPADAQSVDQLRRVDELATQVQAGQVPIEQALAAAGIVPMNRPGQPETPEQRSERFAARAREVGMSEEAAAEVSGRVQLNLDQLTRPVTADEVTANVEELVDELADEQFRLDQQAAEQSPPAKPAPRKRAARPAQ